MKNLLDDSTIVSSDFTTDRPVVGGSMMVPRYGWNIVEEDSDAQLDKLNGGAEGVGLAFHEDFLLLAMQTDPQFKVSDLHSNKQFGFVISVDFVVGSSLGVDGDLRHIVVKSS